jgi:hypothetical protein
MMGAYAIPLPVEPKAQTSAPILPWSVVGPSEQDTVTAQGQLQLLFGLELESQHLSTHKHEARLEGVNPLKQQPLTQRETKRSNAKFAILSGFYTVRNPVAVQDFLVGRRPLLDLLFAALPKVKETWGADAKTELELLHDPEDDSSSLVVHVSSNHPNAYAALDHFDEQWWLNHIGESEGLLNFSVEP